MHPLADALDGGRVGLVPGEGDGRVAGEQFDQCERQHRDREHLDRAESDPPGRVGEH